MPVVPVYQPGQVRERPVAQQDIAANGSANAFGAATGAGLRSLGEGLSQFSAAIEQARELEDVAAAKEADDRFAAWDREAKYGEGGYLTLEGRAAVDARARYERELEARRGQFSAGLSPNAARHYDNAARARVSSSLDQSIVHAAQQRKKWVSDASSSRLDTFANDALAAFANPMAVAKNIAAGQIELRQQGELLGWDAATLKERESGYVSGVRKAVALRIAQTDPQKASEYAQTHEKDLTGEDRADLGKVFSPLLIEEEAKRKAGEFLDAGARPVASTFAATDLPEQAYGLLSVIGGAESGNRYDVRFDGGSGARIDSFADHPRVAADIPQGFAAAGRKSTAAGKYQFVAGTWDRAASQIGAKDFSPENQDRAAWWLAQDDYKRSTGRDLVADLDAGNYAMVRKALAGTWEGLANMSDARFAAKMGAAGRPQFADPGEFLDGISNPLVRDATATRLNAMLSLQEKQAKADAEQLKSSAFAFVDRGMSPDNIPAQTRAALGRTEMAGLWDYYRDRSARGQPVTDDRVLYELQTMYASDPEGFSEIDLFKYRGKLSDADWDKVTGFRQSALQDIRKARTEGLALTSAFSQAESQLEAIGITEAGKTGTEREKVSARKAQFQNALALEMQSFQSANGKPPEQSDVQSMINRLLLPVVIRSPGMFWGTNERDARAFEARTRRDDETVDIAVEYNSIPADIRARISVGLQQELGRLPSQDEIVDRYERFMSE